MPRKPASLPPAMMRSRRRRRKRRTAVYLRPLVSYPRQKITFPSLGPTPPSLGPRGRDGLLPVRHGPDPGPVLGGWSAGSIPRRNRRSGQAERGSSDRATQFALAPPLRDHLRPKHSRGVRGPLAAVPGGERGRARPCGRRVVGGAIPAGSVGRDGG